MDELRTRGELGERVLELERRRVRLEGLNNLMATDHGKFIKQEYQSRLSHIRKQYRHVRAHLPSGAVILAGLQGEEKALSELLNDISDYEIRKNELDNEIAMLKSAIVKANKEPADSGQSILPRGIRDGRTDA